MNRLKLSIFLGMALIAGIGYAYAGQVPNYPSGGSLQSGDITYIVRGGQSLYATVGNGTSSVPGLLQCGSGTSCSGGIISAGGMTALTGDVTASGTGSVAATLANTTSARNDIGLGTASTPSFAGLVLSGQGKIDLNAIALPTSQTGAVFQGGGADGAVTRSELDAFGNAAHFSAIRWDGTNAAPTTLQATDAIGSFNVWGYDGTTVIGPQGAFRCFANQNWTLSAAGTYCDIATTPNGSTTLTQVLKINADGGINTAGATSGDMGVGTINAQGLYVNGVPVSTNVALSSITGAVGSNSIENGSNAQTWNFDALTTGSALTLSSTGITSGKLVNATAANASGTGYAGYFSNTSTGTAYGIYAAESGASNTGYAGYFSNTATTGYAVYANGAVNITGLTTHGGYVTINAGASTTPSALTISGSAVATNAQLSNYFYVTLTHTATTTVSNPTNPTDGQNLYYEFTQDSTGTNLVSWGSAFDFGASGSPTFTTTASKVDVIGFRYSARLSKWVYLGSQLGN